ncbi:virion protein [Staphylococcus phage Machias]|nr:virion protein [Staphylococcus phage Machias]
MAEEKDKKESKEQEPLKVADDDMALIPQADEKKGDYDYHEYDPTQKDTGAFMDALGNQRQATEYLTDKNAKDKKQLRNVKGELDVFGMPMYYSSLDDPNRRIYKRTFELDLPLVFIMPGMPKLNGKLFGKPGEGKLWSFGEGMDRLVNSGLSLVGIGNTKDGRMISFEPKMAEYYKYVQTMASQVHASMGLKGSFDLGGSLQDDKNYGLAYYADKSTSISESAMHEYNQSDIASQVNNKNQEIREQKEMARIGGASILGKITRTIKDSINDMVANMPVIGGIVGNFMEHLDGASMYYPDYSHKSTFDRTYNLEFKFYSAYGDPQSIFDNVYLPFLSLLVLALPLQDSIFSYKQPFIIRANCPGRFECNTGIITSMNIVRGEEGTWTADGFPREITVSINIRDMYPNLMASKSFQRMKFNTGLLSYIDCLAGIRRDQLSIIDKAQINMKTQYSRSMQVIKGRVFQQQIDDAIYGYKSQYNPHPNNPGLNMFT